MSLLLEDLIDYSPDPEILRQEIKVGLQQQPKKLPPKFFYDERGSQLFDRICDLPEYYPTRTETAIMKANINEIEAVIGEEAMLIEYGSGSSLKTRILLDHLPALKAYMPIDISKNHLLKAARDIAQNYLNLDVLPVCTDYTQSFTLPLYNKPVSHKVVFFPGSTIGNFQPQVAVRFLEQVAYIIGDGGGLLIGVDLKKDPNILHAAYNDNQGITAAFNLNILAHLNHRFGSNFNLHNFQHYAFYNPTTGCIEMHLVSTQSQIIQLGRETISFAEQESIITEHSYKYTLPEFSNLAAKAGFVVEKVWQDEECLFSVQYLSKVAR